MMKNRIYSFGILLLTVLTINTVSFSQDDCASATAVADLTGAVCASSSVSATDAIIPGSCEEGTFETWFSFVAQGSVVDVTATASASGFRPEIVIISSDDNTCAGAMSQMGCSDGTGNYTSLTVTGFTGFVPGNTYWILVSSDVNTTTGTLDVCVTNPVTPINDACEGATTLPLDGTCLNGTTVNANDEMTGAIGCQDGAVASHPDVFYSFVADLTSVDFTVNAGTMGDNAEIVVYSGDCITGFFTHGSICGPMPLNGALPAFTPGATYWVAISSSGTEGTFQICATSFTPVASPGQDCPDAQELCDNSGFTIGTVNSGGGTITGSGSDEDLTNASSCFGDQESQSQWYQFTVNTGGDLEFQIIPTTWDDDYDWIVYDITTSGCALNGAAPVACNWSGCNGMTGMTSDVTQYTGGATNAFDYYYDNYPGAGDCEGVPGGADNGTGGSQWENAITLVAGNTYAILINNFTTTSNDGFDFNFGGTGALIGISADFTITGGGCTDFNVTVADNIVALNSDTYTWDWGDGTAVAVGPSTNTHDYTAAGPGTYTVHIVVTDAAGCSKDYYETVSVGTTLAAAAGSDVTVCSGNSTAVGGAPSATGGNGVYTYAWTPNDGTLTSLTVANPTATPTATTTYTLVVTDGLGCTATDDIIVTVDDLPTAAAGGSVTICSNETAVVAGASSSNGTIAWTENGAGSITAGATTLTPTYTPAAGDAGTAVTLTMTVTSNNSCGGTATATYTVNVNALPTAVAGGSVTICSNETTVVAGASATGGTISWTEDGAGSITADGTTVTPTYTPAAGDAGNTVTLTMTVTNATCTPDQTATATYTINVSALPTAVAGGSVTICSNETATVSGASSSGGTISWTEDGVGSITAGGTTLTPTYTPAAGDAGNTVTLTMTVTNTACTPDQTATATYTINVSALPTAVAGGSETICSDGTATVSGASSSGGTILWTHDGVGSLSNATTLTPTYTPAAGDAGNTVILTMTVTNTACTPDQTATATYTVIVNATPTYTVTGTDPTVCLGADGFITVSGLTASTNYDVTYDDDLVTVGPTTIMSDASGDIVISGLNAGTYDNFIVSLTSTGCTTTDATTISLANPGAPVIDDIADQVLCNTTYTLPVITGTGLTGAEGYYSGTGGTGTTYNVGDVISSNMTIYIYDGSGACAAEQLFSVTIDALPTATAGGSATICSNETAVVAGASATDGTILWTEDGVGSISAGGTTTTPTYAPAAGDAGNTVTMTMTVTSNNSCGGTATATYTINVNALPTAVAGGSVTICSNETVVVAGASASGGSILWTEDGAGSITANGTTVAPTYTPAAGDAGNTVTLTMTVTNAVCTPDETATATYSVIVNPLPTATAGGSATICSNETIVVPGASATGGTISWTENGAGSITAGGTTVSPTYTPAAGDAGTTVTLTMTVTNATCTPDQTATATYTVNVNPLPTAAAGGSATICSNETIVVPGASATGGTISWTEDGAGSITAGGTTLTPTYTAAAGDAGNTVTLTMTVTNAVCTPDETATATYSVIVNPLPTATAGGSATICSNETIVVPGASATGGTISWTENGAGSITAGGTTVSPTYTPAAGDAGTTVTLTMTVTNATCTPDQTATATYSVIVSPLPTATAGGSATICSNETIIVSGASSSGGTISWSEDGAGSITAGGTTLTPTYTPAAGDAGNTVTLTMTVTNTACTPDQTATATYTIDVNPLPIAVAGGSASICLTDIHVVGGASSSGGTILWTHDGMGTLTDETTLTPTYTPAAGDAGNTVTLTMTVTNTACTPDQTATAIYTIDVNSNPTITGDFTICVAETEPLTGSGTPDAVTPWSSSDTGIATIAPNGDVTGVAEGVTTITYTNDLGCFTTQAVTVNANPTVSGPIVVCEGSTISLTGSGTPAASTPWVSSNSAVASVSSSGIVAGLTAGLTTITYTDDNGCSVLYSETVNPTPAAPSVSNDTSYCSIATPIDLQAVAGMSGTLTWYSDASLNDSIGTGTTLTPTMTVGSTSYYVTENLNGCISPASEVILLLTLCEIEIPTAFTPDGNLVNDTWELSFLDFTYPNNIVKIYNRWGNLIFESEKGSYNTKEWDGTYNGEPLPVASYYFIIEYNDGDKEAETGTVSIVRK